MFLSLPLLLCTQRLSVFIGFCECTNFRCADIFLSCTEVCSMPVSPYVTSTDSKTSPVCHLGKRFDRLMCQLVATDGVDEEMGLIELCATGI